MNLQANGRNQEVEATVAFDRDGLWVLDPRGAPLKAFLYANIKMAEYTFARSVRWKAVAAGAPTVSSASGNKHWFMVQSQDDFALLFLDKDSYRSVIGAYEIRSGRKVEISETR